MKMSVKAMKNVKFILIHLILAIIILAYIFPIYWVLITSLKPRLQIMSWPPTLFPPKMALTHYIGVLTGSKYLYYLKNSTVVASLVAIITLILAVSASFSLSRLRFLGKRLLSRSILLVYMFPGIVLIIPIFRLMAKLGLYNNLISVVIVHILFTLPFSVWTLRNFFNKIPIALDDAAKIDGASEIGILYKVHLPLITPGLATITIFSFIISWNEYMFPLVLLADPEKQTIPVGIANWSVSYSIDWGLITAGAILTLVPTVVLFLFIGKYFVKGLAAGSVKG